MQSNNFCRWYWTENMSSTVYSWKGYQVNLNLGGFCMDIKFPNGKLEIRQRDERNLHLSEEEYEKFPEALMSRMTRTNQKCNIQSECGHSHDKMSCVSRPFFMVQKNRIRCCLLFLRKMTSVDLNFVE